MSLLRDVLGELVGMFLADMRLSGAILTLIALVAALTMLLPTAPSLAGGVLLFGCLVILTVASARHRR